MTRSDGRTTERAQQNRRKLGTDASRVAGRWSSTAESVEATIWAGRRVRRGRKHIAGGMPNGGSRTAPSMIRASAKPRLDLASSGSRGEFSHTSTLIYHRSRAWPYDDGPDLA